jgi:hypothetical protein
MDSEFDVFGVLLVALAIIGSASWASLDVGADFGIVFFTVVASIPVYGFVGVFVYLLSPPLIAWVALQLGLSLIVWKQVIVHLAHNATPSFLSEDHYPWWGASWIYVVIGLTLITFAFYLAWKDRYC